MDNDSIRDAVVAWFADQSAAEAMYGHISTWETGGVTDMSWLFCASAASWATSCNTAAASFTDDIGAWDTSGVTTMYQMFYEASSFNQDIGDWAVDSVLDMKSMFKYASSFNQDIGGWHFRAGFGPAPSRRSALGPASFARHTRWAAPGR
jgi:hypothetical protein